MVEIVEKKEKKVDDMMSMDMDEGVEVKIRMG